MDRLRAEARYLAGYLPYVLAMLNHACIVLRQEQISSNRRLGGRGDDYATHKGLIAWNTGNRVHTLLHEAVFARGLPIDVVSGGETTHLQLGLIRVTVSKHRQGIEEEPAQPMLAGLGGPVSMNPEWVLKVWAKRVPHVDVPAATRTLADGGWPASDVLARPAIPDDEPLPLVDYIQRAVLFDRTSHAQLPVFARDVVLGKRGRMIDCWSALGEELATDESAG